MHGGLHSFNPSPAASQAKAEGSFHTDVSSSETPRPPVPCSHTGAMDAVLCPGTQGTESTRLQQQRALKPAGIQSTPSRPGTRRDHQALPLEMSRPAPQMAREAAPLAPADACMPHTCSQEIPFHNAKPVYRPSLTFLRTPPLRPQNLLPTSTHPPRGAHLLLPTPPGGARCPQPGVGGLHTPKHQNQGSPLRDAPQGQGRLPDLAPGELLRTISSSSSPCACSWPDTEQPQAPKVLCITFSTWHNIF